MQKTVRQGVIWDMDGVLVDTGEFHFQAWSQALSEHDVPFTLELLRTTFGMNNAGILTVLLGQAPPPEILAEISDRKERLFRRAVRGHAQPLPGVLAWLERLRVAGLRQAIASSAPLANIDALVDELNLRTYFDAIVSGSDLPGKPDPAVFLKAARLIGVVPERCVVVEDAVVGVEGARRAGMKCVAVTTTNPAQALKGANRQGVIVERLDALPLDTFERLLAGCGQETARLSSPKSWPNAETRVKFTNQKVDMSKHKYAIGIDFGAESGREATDATGSNTARSKESAGHPGSAP